MKLNFTYSRILMVKKTKVRQNGEAPIYLRITIDGLRVEISTKKWVALDKWNATTQTVRGNTEDIRLTNTFLQTLLSKVDRIHFDLSLQDRIPTPDEIKNQLLGVEDKPEYKTICDAFDYHNLKMADMVKISKISPKTLMRYQITKNKVVAYMERKFKLSDMPLHELRLAFITEFEHHLLTVDRIQSNTAHKYIKNLKKIMNMAVGLDWIPSNPFNLFKCSYVSTDREILNQDELEVLRLKPISVQRLVEVRDVFVFCCYTGFAYSDVYQFQHDAVIVGLDKEYWLSTNRQKTGTRESVPLLPIPLQIIEKYKNDEYCIKSNKLLPVNSNQRYNSYLKELADICGIKKHLTTHIARHTFATTVTLANGVPIETVSSMLGHKSIRTTQVYAKVVEKKVSDDMKTLRDKLSLANTSPLSKIG
ncbi:site-specific integrase [Fluviicola taffensis]|uniref:Integrase family protein n=1 Tax=Fluviicola taffensis (strain DSM 16823 / NCIMB 13979 / RW262) TaxID=755732 RepID=F2IJA8_FLUTR|nr:site-specific integrase [Fluviicola taffensis]AEA44978.1 integrase family protein [Fluviicola taffensis DSM 16823]